MWSSRMSIRRFRRAPRWRVSFSSWTIAGGGAARGLTARSWVMLRSSLWPITVRVRRTQWIFPPRPWVNAGEQTSLQITKALSIRTRQFEQEEPGERPILDLGGRKFRKAAVKGELTAANHRNETVTLVIRRQFSGDLLSADESPKVVLREEGVYSINRRNELNWTLMLEPGAEKTLTYRYEVLVPH